jgi:uncharacterized RDD family membrane protein YckC
MNEDSEPPSSSKLPPVLPPPDLSRPPPPPVIPPIVASSQAEAGSGVKVMLRTEEEVPAEDSPFQGVASFNARFVAAAIDLVVALSLMAATVSILPGSPTRLGWLVAVAYFLTRDSLPLLDGQSVGKKALRLKAVTSADLSLVGNWQAGAVRNLILVIPPLQLLEIFMLLTREDGPERGRRLGDEWAKTRVMELKKPPIEEPE